MISTGSRISEGTNLKPWPFLLGLATIAALASCDGGPTPAEDEQEPDATVLFPGFTVSDAQGAGGALMGADEGVTYISASPGTFADADRVTLTNLANGEGLNVPLVEGGFDPVPLPAQPGDEIEILVHHRVGTTSRYLTKVPPRKRPRVVRTMPPKDATDVVLSASVVVVFSEPVDASTVTAQNVRLEIAGEAVTGTLTLSEDGLRTEFATAEPLELGTEYTIVATTGVLDLQGEALEEEVRVTFTTEAELASVRAGWWHTCATTVNGDAYCWGANWWGQLGRPVHNDAQSAMPVLTSVNFASLALGSHHTCGLTVGGEAYCWGGNGSGELGDRTTVDRWETAPVSGGHTFVSLTAGYGHTCGLAEDGAAYCWGLNDVGELGIPQDGLSICDGWPCSPDPVPVSGGLVFTAIAGGGMHTCGLTFGGAAYCWGTNGHAQLGNSACEICFEPKPVSGGMSFASLAAGVEHTCGLTAGGAAYCWGLNNVGQLGTGEMGSGDHSTPVAVAGARTYISIVAGRTHTCALTRDGQAFCWGANNQGQLGIGEPWGPFPEPVAVSGDHVFEALTARIDQTCALATTKDVYCWGYNGDGELGIPSTQNPVLSPHLVPDLP